jgi:hypothetical protein
MVNCPSFTAEMVGPETKVSARAAGERELSAARAAASAGQGEERVIGIE